MKVHGSSEAHTEDGGTRHAHDAILGANAQAKLLISLKKAVSITVASFPGTQTDARPALARQIGRRICSYLSAPDFSSARSFIYATPPRDSAWMDSSRSASRRTTPKK